MEIVNVARRFFNDSMGWTILERIAHNTLERSTRNLYLPLSATSALIQYTEKISSFQYHDKSVKVCNRNTQGQCVVGSLSSQADVPHMTRSRLPAGCMAIDFVTVKNLELIRNLQTGSQKYNSLFAVMNHTSTAVGARLLKSQILQPPTDAPTVNMRLDAVESILDNEERHVSLV